MPDAAPAPKTAEDKILPGVVYGLYLVSLLSFWLSLFLGLIIAYVARGNAGPVMESHYTFQIASFWKSIWWRVIAWALIIFGVPLIIVGVGLLMIGAGVAILMIVELWFIVRCVVGLLHLAKGEAYPRPNAWLI